MNNSTKFEHEHLTRIIMKKVSLVLIFLIAGFQLFAQEPVWVNKSDIKEVKLYQNGAMVTRTARANVNSGIQEVVLDGLSPYINPQSITLKGTGDATILSVSYKQDYLKEKKKSKEVNDLQDLLDSLNIRFQQIQNKKQVITETQSLLLANKSIGGANNGVISDELELMVEYYLKKMSELKQEFLETTLKEKKLNDQIEKIRQQLNVLNAKQNLPTGDIVVNLDAKTKSAINFEFSYVIGSYATWYAFYDLRAKDVNSPIELVYKAKVNQNTGEDWSNVKLSLSTGNPGEGGNQPQINPWYINFLQPAMYGYRDDNGAVRSSVPAAAESTVLLNAPVLKAQRLESVVVNINQNQLASEFEIMTPYSIPSDGQDYQVDIQRFEVKASYIYTAVPKLDADAFLTARITDWQDLSLSPGSANVYFDGAYVGETYLNPAETKDTLSISLGRDKRIVIKREKLKEFSSSKMFGSNRERSFTYEISVKNGKKENINIEIEDQVPVSQNKEIEVKTEELSGATYNTETGIIKWNLTVLPGETQKKRLSFSVKYPKDKQVNGL
ncbi:mucoidy inhibitor MuiA [soil metagenome]